MFKYYVGYFLHSLNYLKGGNKVLTDSELLYVDSNY